MSTESLLPTPGSRWRVRRMGMTRDVVVREVVVESGKEPRVVLEDGSSGRLMGAWLVSKLLPPNSDQTQRVQLHTKPRRSGHACADMEDQ